MKSTEVSEASTGREYWVNVHSTAANQVLNPLREEITIMKLKAIDTIYRGFRFRSRLEARWAVFFDTLGIPFEYEKEGYDLNGAWYLPDFWIPCWDSYVEIKPDELSDEEFEKCWDLSALSEKRVIAICGQPWSDEYLVTLFWHRAGDPDDQFYEGPVFEELMITQCRSCASVYLIDDNCNNPFNLGHPDQSPTHPNTCKDNWPSWSVDLQKAYSAARQARFEKNT